MINLSLNRDLKSLSDSFYGSIKTEIESRVQAHKSFFNTSYSTFTGQPFGDYLESKIEEIITKDLNYILTNIKPEIEKVILDNYKNISKKVQSDFKKNFNNIFFFEEYSKWNPYSFVKLFDLKCCPYCNRTYITVLGDDKKKFSRPDIDHFMPKYKYPYLRFSFFNLIPSCIICNRNAKGKKESSLGKNIYPYEEGFENQTKFTYNPKYYKDMKGGGSPNIKFKFLGSDVHRRKSKKNVTLFKLVEQYSIHVEELKHLIELKTIHSEGYIQDLMTKYPTLLKDEKEAYKLAFGKEIDLIHDEKRPLSKFTRDILEELQMLKGII